MQHPDPSICPICHCQVRRREQDETRLSPLIESSSILEGLRPVFASALFQIHWSTSAYFTLPLAISYYDPITSGTQNSAILVCSIHALLVGRCLVCSFPVKRLHQEMIVFGRNVNVQRWQLSRKSARLGLEKTYHVRILCIGISRKGANESRKTLCCREILFYFLHAVKCSIVLARSE